MMDGSLWMCILRRPTAHLPLVGSESATSVSPHGWLDESMTGHGGPQYAMSQRRVTWNSTLVQH